MSRILVIDDEGVIRNLMCEILERAGYETIAVETSGEALERLEDLSIALVVSDIVMPGLNGLELLEEVRARRPSLPVILVTGAGTYENLSQAVTRGADGLVIKPFSHADLQSAVAAALERARRSGLDGRERLLAPTLAATLADAIEARGGELQGHCERLALLAGRIAEGLGLTGTAVERIRLGAVLHDAGKIGVPDHVLRKDGPLTDEESALMRIHPLVGHRLLQPLDFLPEVLDVVRHHHERWDGSGYPEGLAGEAIPRAARIAAVADAVESMSAPRPYGAPLTRDAIVSQLRAGRATQWDPEAVDVVIGLVERGELRFAGDGLRVVDGSTRPTCDETEQSILLVEGDDEAARRAVRSIEHTVANVRVVHARDIRSATELCHSSRWSLALVDDVLPDGDGLDFLRTVKARTPSLRVVMLTSEGAEATAIEAFRSGASDYVVKSEEYVAELSERVRTFLEASA